MNSILKMTKLDFYLIKSYSRSMIFTMIYPVVLGIMNKSLVSGITFTMVFIGMMTGYVFSISEKNDMERLYSILPVSKKYMVIGRYIYACMLGVIGLLFSLMIQSIVLQALGIAISSTDIPTAILTGSITFSFYPVFLFPGYYKYGYIKGRYFVLIPLAGYLGFVFVASNADISALSSILSDPVIFSVTALMICMISILLSVTVSIKILQNKEV